MKISKTSKSNIRGIDYTVGENKLVDNVSDTFESRLSKVNSDNQQSQLSALLNEIEEQAKKMSKRVDIRELKIYKRLVSQYLDQTVNGSHKFLKENKIDRLGRHRVYAIIKRINENLENLTEEVLKNEKDNIKLLQQLDDIRGLLLDIST